MIQPKVIILGGPPMIGKSSVARHLASRLTYGCISTDDIGLAIKSATTAETHPRLHSMDGIDYRDYYIERSAQEILTDGMGTHEETWPGIEAVVRTHADWSYPVVFEGWAMWPERVAELLAELDTVSALWLTADDDLLESRVRATERFYAGASDQEAVIQKFVPRNIEYNELMMSAVDRLGLPSVKVGSHDSTEQITNRCAELLGISA